MPPDFTVMRPTLTRPFARIVWLGWLLLAWLSASPARGQEAERAWAALEQGPAVLLLRHARAPGTGDPAGFQLGDCRTQRNLDEDGRRQASRIGAALRARGVRVAAVLSSQWCRCLDTAQALGLGPVREEPAFNSFFQTPEQEADQTAAARRLLSSWTGPGVQVVVTHQVNITALTGVVPASGEAVVLAPEAGRPPGTWRLVGRLDPNRSPR